MSQYPWIYQPPSPPPRGHDPAAHLLGPARRAGILAMILGGVLLLCGSATFLVGWGWDRLPASVRSDAESNLARYGAGNVPMGAVYITVAVFILIAGVVMVVMGIFAMRGGLGSIISLMILDGLLLVFLVLQVAGALATAGSDPRLLSGVCVIVLAISMLGLLMWFLAGAVRAAPQVWLMRMQYQNPLWQYQQNQQMYQQGAAGAYGGMTPPAPPQQPPNPDEPRP